MVRCLTALHSFGKIVQDNRHRNKLVVDSSVAIKWFVVEPFTAEARLILNQYKAGTLVLLAPDLINAEVGNVVWKKHTFQGLAKTDAQQIIDSFLFLTFNLTPTASLLNESFRLAVQLNRTVYDALYLALSIRERCRFVTADERLVNAVSPKYKNAIWIGNWPGSGK